MALLRYAARDAPCTWKRKEEKIESGREFTGCCGADELGSRSRRGGRELTSLSL